MKSAEGTPGMELPVQSPEAESARGVWGLAITAPAIQGPSAQSPKLCGAFSRSFSQQPQEGFALWRRTLRRREVKDPCLPAGDKLLGS